ncbi:PREDICTED: auxin efflux carrier component 8-like [Camelina sativa]|uniref:Auxin efflux carrier component 8-like n=1 Tax=Camelina sativa TaxID=90675 RepID=A0ABM1QTG3_CAMSA|nr:PREDICTED: auxin efflux carrier component 8-like [Camelina sativa]
MISWLDVYHVVSATVPLYVSMILGYLSAKHLQLFTPEQCAGINKFVAKFCIPLLSFQIISQNNPFKMNPKLILSDILQKLLALVVLTVVVRFWHPTGGRGGRLGWVIIGLSISVFPNTLILGIPILAAIYGDEAASILRQIVVMQSLIWYTILLFLFEINAARAKTSSGSSTEHNTGGNDNEEVNREEEEPKEEEEVAIVRTSLFMASQRSFIACGTKMAVIAMLLKFVLGPALMIASVFIMRLRNNLFKIAILQAALPQGVVPFVFAKEYNLHPEIVSTGVIFGMLIALPTILAYYFVLDI